MESRGKRFSACRGKAHCAECTGAYFAKSRDALTGASFDVRIACTCECHKADNLPTIQTDFWRTAVPKPPAKALETIIPTLVSAKRRREASAVYWRWIDERRREIDRRKRRGYDVDCRHPEHQDYLERTGERCENQACMHQMQKRQSGLGRAESDL